MSYCHRGEKSQSKLLGLLFPRGSKGQSVPGLSPSFWWLAVILDVPGLVNASLQSLLVFTLPLSLPLCFCVSTLPLLSLIKTLVLDLGSILDLQWSHLKSSITFAKTLFPSMVTSQLPGIRTWMCPFGRHTSTHYNPLQQYSSTSFPSRPSLRCLHNIPITFPNSNLLANCHDIQNLIHASFTQPNPSSCYSFPVQTHSESFLVRQLPAFFGAFQ